MHIRRFVQIAAAPGQRGQARTDVYPNKHIRYLTHTTAEVSDPRAGEGTKDAGAISRAGQLRKAPGR